MSIKVEVWGDYACFSMPELKTERYSYPVMTPSAARGILEAVFWHDGLRYYVDRIYVMNDITYTNIRRNELKSKISHTKARSAMSGKKVDLSIISSSDIQQRASTVLKNVHYVIEAHFEMTDKANPSDNPAKFQSILSRRLEKGQAFMSPYLGCREFPAKYRRCDFDTVPTADITQSLGLMLYDMDYSDPENIKPLFFHAKLEHGVLNVADSEVLG